MGVRISTWVFLFALLLRSLVFAASNDPIMTYVRNGFISMQLGRTHVVNTTDGWGFTIRWLIGIALSSIFFLRGCCSELVLLRRRLDG